MVRPRRPTLRKQSAKSISVRSGSVAHPGPGAPERAGHRDHQGRATTPSPPSCSAARPAPVRAGGVHRWAPFGRIHAGGDARRRAREYDRTRVGVVTGRIVPAISDGALARALRVLGAAGVAGGDVWGGRSRAVLGGALGGFGGGGGGGGVGAPPGAPPGGKRKKLFAE